MKAQDSPNRVCVSVDDETIRRADALANRVGEASRLTKISRHRVLQGALLAGLDVLEREHPAARAGSRR